MTESIKAKVGFVSSGRGWQPHFQSFTPLIPGDVSVGHAGLQIHKDSLYEIEGKKDIIIRKIRDIVSEHEWDGVMVTGAPTEVLTPGLLADLRASLDVPVTTALNACVAALSALTTSRVLLLTPFDPRLNGLICDYLAQAGIAATAPRPFENIGEAMKLGPQEVFDLTKKALDEADRVDAVYFQGAVLDPLKVLERIENDLGIPVIASNPAMLWYVLSKLGLSYRIEGYGRLVREWPSVAA